MPARSGGIHVATTSRTYKGKTYHTHLLRRTFREEGKVKHQTLGNISHLPAPVIDLIRRSLKGEQFLPASDSFEIREAGERAPQCNELAEHRKTGPKV